MKVYVTTTFLSGEVLSVKSSFPSLNVFSFLEIQTLADGVHTEAETVPSWTKEMGHTLKIKLTQHSDKGQMIWKWGESEVLCIAGMIVD
jgi:hypothetical protein